MGYAIVIIAAVIIAATVSVIIFRITAHKKLKTWLKSSFGKSPMSADDSDLESISKYSLYMNKHSGSKLRIDDITWNDLDMDKVFERINTCLTSVGEEYLYNCLHDLPPDPSTLTARENFLEFLDRHPEERLSIQTFLYKAGRENYNGLSRLIFHNEKSLPNSRVYNVLAAFPLLSALILFLNIPVGSICLIASFVINSVVYYGTQMKMHVDLPAIKYFASLLHCCEKLCKIERLKPLPPLVHLRENYNVFKALKSKTPMNSAEYGSDFTRFAAELSNMLFFQNIRHYNKYIDRINTHKQEFHALYKSVGEIDLSVCVLSFRKSLPVFSIPDFHEHNKLAFEDISHVLLSSPVPNTGTLKNDSIITGSNASGKSTFIKALAVNGILAQTLYTCTAKRFATRFSLIMTSMAVRDNVFDGNSYFIVEINSLKRILDAMQHSACTCYIDEILRGTNTIERIAASASVLEYIHKQDCLCLVASHDIELTRILAKDYDNYHFSEHITDNGILFDYKLKEGAATTRNAVKLLGHMGFDPEIVKKAEALTARYEESKTWVLSLF
ncbi:MAG: hypothetical protein FWG14_11020 [Peptococcaceae bacterium]|nr:hypothetical protein [Peptococcaceae bacterium]